MSYIRSDLTMGRIKRRAARDSRQKCRLTHFGITKEEDGHLGRINGGVCHGNEKATDGKQCMFGKVE